MIPAIEYQLQAVVLTELECEKNYGEDKDLFIGRKDLKKLFKMNLVILQGLYWTAKCIGEKNVNLRKLCHSYVNDSLKMLRDNGISICDHELITDNYNKCHRYLGGCH
ncbi:13514_t:CDS:2 [Rhizophagus irregularis]|nr:13514_t:CDS:2 [Rhizophagus irregularis]